MGFMADVCDVDDNWKNKFTLIFLPIFSLFVLILAVPKITIFSFLVYNNKLCKLPSDDLEHVCHIHTTHNKMLHMNEINICYASQISEGQLYMDVIFSCVLLIYFSYSGNTKMTMCEVGKSTGCALLSCLCKLN